MVRRVGVTGPSGGRQDIYGGGIHAISSLA